MSAIEAIDYHGFPVYCFKCREEFGATDSYGSTCPHCGALNAIHVEEWFDSEEGVEKEEWHAYDPDA